MTGLVDFDRLDYSVFGMLKMSLFFNTKDYVAITSDFRERFIGICDRAVFFSDPNKYHCRIDVFVRISSKADYRVKAEALWDFVRLHDKLDGNYFDADFVIVKNTYNDVFVGEHEGMFVEQFI